MSKLLDQSVSQSDDDTWSFQCPGVADSPCGAEGQPFSSAGWPTKKAAAARGQQHFAEHKGDASMQSLADFRKDQGLTVDSDGVVRLEDI